jgi:hypothetical protein
MALTFASGQYVNAGSASNLDDLGAINTAFTVWGWFYRTSNGANQHMITKDGAFPSGWVLLCDNAGGEGGARFVIFKSTTGSNWAEAHSAVGMIPLNTWTFVAGTHSSTVAGASTIKLFIGNLSTAAVEPTYTLQQAGSNGAPDADASYNLYVGNLSRATTLPFLGRIARAGVVRRALDQDELRRIQFGSLIAANVPDTRLLFDLHGTGTQIDYSGNGNTGAVTSATVADHAPLIYPYAPPLWSVVWSSTSGAALASVVTASATLAAALTIDKPLAAAVTATSTVAAVLTVDKPLVSAVSATATLAADLTVAKPLASVVSATATITADLTVAKPLVAAISATSTVVADLTVAKPLETTVSAAATLAASLTIDKPLATAVTATAALVADLTVAKPLDVVIVCGATIAGDLTIAGAGPDLNSAVTATAIIAADLTVAKPLNVVVVASATLAGALTVPKPLAAVIGPTALLVANLTVPQDITPGTLLGVVTVLPQLSAVQSIRPALSGIVELEP